jgi:hypothetical protein
MPQQAAIDVPGIDTAENGAVPGLITVGAFVNQPRVQLLLMSIHPELLATGKVARLPAPHAVADDVWRVCRDNLPEYLSLRSVHDVSFRRDGRGHTFANDRTVCGDVATSLDAPS